MTLRHCGAGQRALRGALHQLVDVGVGNAIQCVGPAAASIPPTTVLSSTTGCTVPRSASSIAGTAPPRGGWSAAWSGPDSRAVWRGRDRVSTGRFAAPWSP
ncbi:hypothetical protein I553_4419 [Mycobacterium xenopi 4042]|uniref:Uncharacterized protein n=1 Tax=Mycobacterium xenopi 4042 TaxID=1299334 RepID=X8AGL3_MYCXE|nr:hypothetical protein I553_4419 [Mycobacterium xenopi 4042]